ncbi:hypothetical protein TrLO_g6161, partial [Triparma laevis f. longispina]
MTSPLFLLLLLLLPPSTLSSCPNNCAGHGTCGVGGVCTCFSGFGYSADCSLRTCPTGPAWADKAYSPDSAHSLTECSGAGICDRSVGICECFEGYTGAACRRSACPNDCSGNGVCMTIRDAGLYLGSDYASGPGSTGGDGLGPKYTNWDFESIGVCNCDMGFFGPDCSRRMCPKADDPVTINQNSRRVGFVLHGSGSYLDGILKIGFLGHTAEFSLGAQWSASYCKQQWEKLDNIKDVTCVVAEGNPHTSLLEGQNVTMNVTFNSFPTIPSENNFFSHSGNPAITAFTCDASSATSNTAAASGAVTSCLVKDLIYSDVKEYEFCGRRGTCDFTSGLCYCFTGYTGMDCTSKSYSTSASNAEPALAATATGNDFIGNALEIQTEKPASADFQFLSCKADGTEVFSINGQGRIKMGELVITETGATIQQGGINVDAGGMTIKENGLWVTNTLGGVNTAQLTASNTAMTKAVMALYSNTVASKTSFKFIEAGESAATTVFDVRGDGKTTISGGGLDVSGGATITTGGLGITDGGATIGFGTVHHGGIVDEYALNVVDGAEIKNSRSNATVLKLSTGVDTHNGTVLSVETNTKATGNYFGYQDLIKTVLNNDADESAPPQVIFRVHSQPKTEVMTGGFLVRAGGTTVTAGGLVVNAGGLTIGAGGMALTGDVTFASGVYMTGTAQMSGINADMTGATLTGGFTSSGVTSFTAAVDAQSQTLTLAGATIEGGVTHVGLETFSGGIALAGT